MGKFELSHDYLIEKPFKYNFYYFLSIFLLLTVLFVGLSLSFILKPKTTTVIGHVIFTDIGTNEVYGEIRVFAIRELNSDLMHFVATKDTTTDLKWPDFVKLIYSDEKMGESENLRFFTENNKEYRYVEWKKCISIQKTKNRE